MDLAQPLGVLFPLAQLRYGRERVAVVAERTGSPSQSADHSLQELPLGVGLVWGKVGTGTIAALSS